MRNLEVFESNYTTWTDEQGETVLSLNCDDAPTGTEDFEAGPDSWFFWFCLPGCLPDSDAFGPYITREQALEAAEEMFGDY